MLLASYRRPAIFTVATLILLSACQTTPSQRVITDSALADPTATPPISATPAAHDMVNSITWVQTSVEYRLVTGQIYRNALDRLDLALKSPNWSALVPDDHTSPSNGLPPAIILDVDETVLDNSAYHARLIRDHLPRWNEAGWVNWVHEESAPPVPGALEFVRAAASRGVEIFYISNRTTELNDATARNLKSVGFPIQASNLLTLGTEVKGCRSFGSDKSCRRQLVGRTHRVLMQVGDQIEDMLSIRDRSRTGREQAISPYLGWVGERWFVLPNPTYGSWESALFNTSQALPEEELRRQKLDALRYR